MGHSPPPPPIFLGGGGGQLPPLPPASGALGGGVVCAAHLIETEWELHRQLSHGAANSIGQWNPGRKNDGKQGFLQKELHTFGCVLLMLWHWKKDPAGMSPIPTFVQHICWNIHQKLIRTNGQWYKGWWDSCDSCKVWRWQSHSKQHRREW